MLNRFFGYDQPACSHCGHREQQLAATRPASNLLGWFDSQMQRMEDDLFRNRFDMPSVPVFDTERRSRMFDALFAPLDQRAEVALAPRFVENANTNQLECQLSGWYGDVFRPEDVEVNIDGRNVEFKARREDRSEDGQSYSVREVRRFFTVPENADAERLEAQMSPSGKLMVTAPLLKPAVEQKKENGPIPIKINRK